ncbi:hypothetical protein [Desulfosporosinus sp.]|uniref:hypothetical protein n=1 Tax=Desulfosporosinus sp. TaxID=157907 RepID=UPI0025BCBDA8|nr:hypothetical protein [Desulfosporosinus sp.]MBC2721815.1 hypothetical protein [Desulfosporosinus sp.]MBC2726281.1 hypothetical protein [Desulfosporosinus sp.]
MLGRIKKAIRKQFLKVDWIKAEVEAYQNLQREKRYHQEWAQRLHSGNTVRELDPQESHKTRATVTDDEVIVEYMDGRMIGQRPVTPTIIRPFGMGRRER